MISKDNVKDVSINNIYKWTSSSSLHLGHFLSLKTTFCSQTQKPFSEKVFCSPKEKALGEERTIPGCDNQQKGTDFHFAEVGLDSCPVHWKAMPVFPEALSMTHQRTGFCQHSHLICPGDEAHLYLLGSIVYWGCSLPNFYEVCFLLDLCT